MHCGHGEWREVDGRWKRRGASDPKIAMAKAAADERLSMGMVWGMKVEKERRV